MSEAAPETPVPVPPVVTPPPPAAPPVPPPPADWKGPAKAWEDTYQARQEAKAAREAAAAATAALAAAKAEATSAAQALAAERERNAQDAVLREIGGQFTAASVARVVRREYADVVAEAKANGQTPPAFDAWIKSDAVKADPVFAGYFPKPKAADPLHIVDPVLIDDPPPRAPERTTTGTVPTPTGPNPVYTDALVAKLTAEGKFRPGRVDTATGNPIGGSPHWQAWVRQQNARAQR